MCRIHNIHNPPNRIRLFSRATPERAPVPTRSLNVQIYFVSYFIQSPRFAHVLYANRPAAIHPITLRSFPRSQEVGRPPPEVGGWIKAQLDVSSRLSITGGLLFTMIDCLGSVVRAMQPRLRGPILLVRLGDALFMTHSSSSEGPGGWQRLKLRFSERTRTQTTKPKFWHVTAEARAGTRRPRGCSCCRVVCSIL